MPQLVGQEVGKTGYGLMGLTWRPHPQDDEESFKAMKASLASGCNFWNGGEFYGPTSANSLVLMEKYFTKYPEDASKVVLSIKGGINTATHAPDSSPEGVRTSLDNCIAQLKGKKKIDLFECARVDPKTPIEWTMKVLEEEYVKTGKIGGISLSEVGAATIERAAKVVTKIEAVEVELSLWATEPLTNGITEVCAKHGITVVAYSPIGRGILSGEIKSPADIPEGDFRKSLPRFSEENFPKNLVLVKQLEAIASKRNITAAQLAIEWVRQLSEKDGNPVIIPIPGASKEPRVLENAEEVSLTKEDLVEIDKILGSFKVEGGRYGGPLAALMDG